MKVTYYGHSCFSVDVGGHVILFDPFITPNELAKDVDISAIKPDTILLTHGHEDHLVDLERIYKQSEPMVVGNNECIGWLGEKGVKKAHPMNHGGRVRLDFGMVKYVNAVHSSVLPDGTYGGNPGGFVVETAEGNFYFAGDTALTYDMKLLGEFHKLDFAFLPIGDNFTMGFEDAARAADFIKCNRIIGMHYDTFPYIKIDKDEAKQHFTSMGKELNLLKIGETREF